MKILRKILRVSWTAKKTNKWVLNKAGTNRDLLLSLYCHSNEASIQLYYSYSYSHTMRKQGNCLEKYIMQRTMPGAQRQGRPCTAWMDNIKTWTGLPVEESIRMTEFGRREISCGPAMDHGHEAQPRRPGRDVARRCVEPVADHVRSTRLQVRGECTASQRQLDNVDKSRRRLLVLRAVAPRTDHPAACLLDVQGRCHCPPPHQIQRHRHRHLPTMLVQRDTVVLRQLL